MAERMNQSPFMLCIVWHPDYVKRAEIAERLYHHFGSHHYRSIVDGVGVSVLFRGTDAPCPTTPLPIEWNYSDTTTVVVLIDNVFDGVVVGQQVSERTVKELSAGLQQIDPPVFLTVERVSIDGGREAVAVNTSQGTLRPYTYCLGLHRVPRGRHWGIITGGTIGGAMCPIYLGLTMTKRRGGIVSGHD